jgi:hypothetical protein
LREERGGLSKNDEDAYFQLCENTEPADGTMTKLLERAFDQARALSEREQDSIADLILNELGDEARWAKAFAASADALATLAEEALAEDRAKKTRSFDPDQL